MNKSETIEIKKFFRQQLDTIECRHETHIIYLGSILLMKKTEKY